MPNWIIRILAKLGDPGGSGISNMCCHFARASNVVERIQVLAAPSTLALESITIAGLPANANIEHAFLWLTTRKIDNTDQVNDNSLDGATVPGVSQVIQIRPVVVCGLMP